MSAQHPDTEDSAFKLAYLDQRWARATFYDALSEHYLQRCARYVLLLHANRINARFLPDVI